MVAAASDRVTKQMIVFAVCGIAVMFAVTECLQAVYGGHVAPEINQMSTLVIGALIGWLGKTGVDYVTSPHLDTLPTATATVDADSVTLTTQPGAAQVASDAKKDGAA
jgi:uncharacterized membrane protein (DUF441 family)